MSFLFALQINSAEKTRENKNLAIKEIALTIQNEIDLASKSSDGYHREFSLPRSILGSNYEISVIEGLVYVRTTDGKYAIALPVSVVEGEIQKGNNLIRKIEGVVYLNS